SNLARMARSPICVALTDSACPRTDAGCALAISGPTRMPVASILSVAPWVPTTRCFPLHALPRQGWISKTGETAPTPLSNGQPLQLEQYETSRSLTIAPDAQRFVL